MKKTSKPCIGTELKHRNLETYITYSSNFGLQSMCKRKGIKWDVNAEYLRKVASESHRADEIWSRYSANPLTKYAPTFDRIDPRYGFVKGNLQLLAVCEDKAKDIWDRSKVLTPPENIGESGYYGVATSKGRYIVTIPNILDETDRAVCFKDLDDAVEFRDMTLEHLAKFMDGLGIQYLNVVKKNAKW